MAGKGNYEGLLQSSRGKIPAPSGECDFLPHPAIPAALPILPTVGLGGLLALLRGVIELLPQPKAPPRLLGAAGTEQGKVLLPGGHGSHRNPPAVTVSEDVPTH